MSAAVAQESPQLRSEPSFELASLVWIIGLTRPVFDVFGRPVSWRDIVLIVGGLFLLYKGTTEIHQGLEGDEQTADAGRGRALPAWSRKLWCSTSCSSWIA
jgi:predicted tellurium resistance membrane protein TerC